MSSVKNENFKVSVVLRSYNDAELLPRTLQSLDDQQGVDIELFVFESASTDGSKEIIERHGYSRIEHLAQGTYHSSTVLNTGTQWAETEYVAFVNSDAILLSDDVLLKLVLALEHDQKCCGAFAKQVTRPDATVRTKLDHYIAFENRSQLGETSDYMSLVTSIIRRSCWQKIPFETSLTYAEDYVWSDQVKKAGFALKYVDDAVVEHSHNYSDAEIYRRSYGDAAAINIISTQPPAKSVLFGAVVPYLKRMLRDILRLQEMGELSSIATVLKYRWYGTLGNWHGTRDAWLQRQQSPGANQPIIKRQSD